LLTAAFKDLQLHIENSKNYKRWYCKHHTDCVSMFWFWFSGGSNFWPSHRKQKSP